MTVRGKKMNWFLNQTNKSIQCVKEEVCSAREACARVTSWRFQLLSKSHSKLLKNLCCTQWKMTPPPICTMKLAWKQIKHRSLQRGNSHWQVSNPSKGASWLIKLQTWLTGKSSPASVPAEFLWFLPVRPTFFRQEKQRFFFLFLSGVWSLSDKLCAASSRGSEGGKKKKDILSCISTLTSAVVRELDQAESTLALIWDQTAVLCDIYLSCWRCSPLLRRQPPVAQSPRLLSPGRCSSLSSAELQDWESWDWHTAKDAG